ncbi:MAG: hypothetical protein WA144_15415 [Candidatus Methanoperedens sp.]
MPDLCAYLSRIDKNTQALKDNFISPDYEAPGIVWRIVAGRKVGYRKYGNWDEKRSVNFQVLYEQIITYTDTTITLNLDIPVNAMLNRIEMISSDNTAKTYEIREYTDWNNDSYYNFLKTSTANQGVRWLKPYSNHFLPAGSRLQFVFSSFTAGKTIKLIVATEEI